MATAVEYKHQGYNCAEAMVKACNDLHDMRIPSELASPFGGGMACGDTCGAVVGALMALGLMGCDEKKAIELLRRFRADHGATDCAVLLRASKDRGEEKKAHCDGLVYEMVQAVEELTEK